MTIGLVILFGICWWLFSNELKPTITFFDGKIISVNKDATIGVNLPRIYMHNECNRIYILRKHIQTKL